MEVSEDQNSEKKKIIAEGPWGGYGGNKWDDGVYSGVREITLVYDRCIDSIRVVYNKNGKPFIAERHGGLGGNKTGEIKLRFPDEFLVSISGYYCPVVYEGSPVIRSLTFRSNRRTFGPFGSEEGTGFSFAIEAGKKIVGFYGRSGWYLDSIGLRSSPQKTNLFQKIQRNIKRLGSIAASTDSQDRAQSKGGKTRA